MSSPPAPRPPAVKEYAVPVQQPSLFGSLEGDRFEEDGIKNKSRGLRSERRLDILFESLQGRADVKKRVVDVLDRVVGDDEAFSVTLDTLAYAMRRSKAEPSRGIFDASLREVEGCISNGRLPVAKMRNLLDVGFVFDRTNHSQYSDETIAIEMNYINGGMKMPDYFPDVPYTPREEVVSELQYRGVNVISIQGSSVPVGQANERYLRGVYTSRITSEIAFKRKSERFINTGDW